MRISRLVTIVMEGSRQDISAQFQHEYFPLLVRAAGLGRCYRKSYYKVPYLAMILGCEPKLGCIKMRFKIIAILV